VRAFIVGPGVKGFLVEDGKHAGQKATKVDYVTAKTTCFEETDVLFHPSGKVGRHGPASQTLAGHYAAEGYVGFLRPGKVLIVPASQTQEVDAA
jgi:hypothetical protein